MDTMLNEYVPRIWHLDTHYKWIDGQGALIGSRTNFPDLIKIC